MLPNLGSLGVIIHRSPPAQSLIAQQQPPPARPPSSIPVFSASSGCDCDTAGFLHDSHDHLRFRRLTTTQPPLSHIPAAASDVFSSPSPAIQQQHPTTTPRGISNSSESAGSSHPRDTVGRASATKTAPCERHRTLLHPAEKRLTPSPRP
ncbi:hypothetical protein EX30DRAFT_120577 [Ascodesmis nigricans]|uniref:Uncharacterized protein n=1 Tax=Ascodesmis nigricans TaxID=341454 RepID=A0A4S2MRV8_9PEZI|nr:hypothetical protein EX30DRAFT_120577 [Ascodesmis nigricans]